MKVVGKLLVILALVGVLAASADAFPVAGVGKRGFADFSKAIVFTGSACPANAETVQTNTGAKNCAIPMKPVGDGSWVCTAVIFPGTNFTYYFEYRVPAFEDTNGWKNAAAGGARNQDPVKDVTLPGYTKDGFVVYNIFGDKTVRGDTAIGKAGTLDTELTTANPYVAQYRGTLDVDNTGDNDTTNLEGANSFNVTVAQTADTTVKITWTFGFGDGAALDVEGAREFDTTSTYTPYGFKILRARLPAGWKTDTTNPGHLVFEDTVVNKVTGDTLFSPSRTSYSTGWYDGTLSFTDTSLPVTGVAIGDTFIYTVIWQDAYGNRNDTADQNFAGGADDFIRQPGVEVIFLVEKFDPEVVFPNGATEGTIYLTPYVNGVPQPFKTVKTKAYIAQRQSKG